MKLNNIRYCRDRENIILPLCQGKNVLHLGCADATQLQRKAAAKILLHDKLSEVAGALHGVDSNISAINQMIEFGYKDIYLDDVETLNNSQLLPKYDIVVAAEIIEHLFNPGKMIDAIKNKLKKNGTLIITTPNPISLRFWAHYMMGEEISSPHHLIAFTFSTIHAHLVAKGYEKIDLYGTQPSGHNSARHTLIKPLVNLLLKIFPQYGDEMVIIAKLK